MRYLYRAVNRDGQETDGHIQARNRQRAVFRLSQIGFIDIKLSIDFTGIIKNLIQNGFGGVSELDKMMFIKHLSVMIRAQLTLDQSLRILQEEVNTGKMKTVLSLILRNVENGSALSDSLANFPNIFSILQVNMTRAAEESGTLGQSLENISIQIKKDYDLKQKVFSAMLYPVLVLMLTGVLGILMATFVLPKITKLFDSFSIVPPLPTRILIVSANMMQNYGVWLLVLILGMILFFFWLLSQDWFKYKIDKYSLKLPIFGKLIVSFNQVLFARTLATLIKSGVPISQAVYSTSQTFKNLYFKKILQTANGDIQQGAKLSTSLSKSIDAFPPMVNRMVSVGEDTGRIEEVLFYLSDFFEGEVDNRTENLTTFLEPLLLLVIGFGVGFVALSIVMPLYQISGSFRG